MSYLLDALRKADHERQLGTVPDLATAADTVAASQQGTPIWLVVVIAGVVALNIAVLGTVMWQWLGGLEGDRPLAAKTVNSGAAEVAKRSSTAPQPSSRKGKTVAAGARRPAAPTNNRGANPAGVSQSPVGSAPDGLGAAQRMAAAGAATSTDSSLQAREAEPSALVTVESYASPVERYGEVPWLRELPQAVRADLPEYTLNGLLYSSVPGVSFVLINGGRYHEGERIPAGGAVVTIRAEGVVINYKGRRFRLPAPD